jgi:hypothetical protein
MKLINGKNWINLEDHLDINSFDILHDKITFAIAKNAKHIETSYTPRNTLFNPLPGFLEERIKNKEMFPEFDQSQINWYTKLKGTITLGTHLMLRGNKGYPRTYQYKHLNEYSADMPWANDFDFLFKWINDQKCFSEYGRVMFWINEPGQKTALHTDYGNINSEKKDMFIWLTGRFKKRIILKDNVTGETYLSSYRAMIFNNVNWHGSIGDEQFTSWSLRIDGVFLPEWAESVKIKEYFNL